MRFFAWWNKQRLVQLIVAMQTVCALALAFYLAYAMKFAFSSFVPFMFQQRSLIFQLGICFMAFAPLVRAVIVALAVLWWLSQQRKIIERSGRV